VTTRDSPHDSTNASLSAANFYLFVLTNVSVKVPIVASATSHEKAHWKGSRVSPTWSDWTVREMREGTT
jgi:hypothetical protein